MVYVDHEAGPVLLDREAQGRHVAGEDAAGAGKALLGPHRTLAALEHAPQVKALLERRDDGRRQARGARGEKLADDEVAVPVDHDTRQAVALAVRHPIRVEAGAEQLVPERERLVQAAVDERGLDWLVVGGEDADGDRRPRVAVAGGEEAAVRRHHAHGLSGLRALESRGDRTREDPRVAGPDRAVAPRLERDHPHGPPPDYRSPGRTKVPLRPPVFRTRRTCPRVMPRSTALHMS